MLNFPSFHELVRSKGAALTVSDLANFAEERRRGCNRSSIKLTVALMLFVGLVSFYLSAFGQPTSWPAILMISLSIASLTAIFWFALEAAVENNELDSVEYALKRLAEQDEIVGRAISLADHKPGIALVLRSFEVEYQGYSDEEIESTNRSSIELMQVQSQMYGVAGGGVSVETKNIWTVQKEVIATIQMRLHTVLLENVTLSQSKRAELEAAHTLVVPVVLGEWWPVFTRLADRASIVVFFLQNFSAELRREIDYILEHRCRYIVVCGEGTKDSLRHSQQEGARRLLDGALHVVTYHDVYTGAGELREKLSSLRL
jgi:Ca2+/Na+ antiporter